MKETNMTDENLEHLFSQARSQDPVAAFDETKRAFLTATVVAAGGTLATKGLLKLLTAKKWIIMMSTVSIITTSAIIATVAFQPGIESPTPNNPTMVTTPGEKQQEELVMEESTVYHEGEEEEIMPIVIDEDATVQLDEEELVAEYATDRNKPASNVNITSGSGSSPYQLVQAGEKIKPYSQRFLITESTTEAELETMKADAAEAGIDMTYKVRYKKDKITKLDLTMKVEDEKDGSSHNQMITSNMSFSGNFSYVFEWVADDAGNIIEMRCGDEDEMGQLYEELDDLNFIANDFMLAELDSLCEALAIDLEVYLQDLEKELAENKTDFQNIIALESDEMEVLILELSEAGLQLAKVLEMEMEELQEEIEKALEEVEREMEEGNSTGAPAKREEQEGTKEKPTKDEKDEK